MKKKKPNKGSKERKPIKERNGIKLGKRGTGLKII